ncbi:hypothetical protein BC827DRAFT_1151773 [Russula dissimulans]|nr:hypothetical protein BC827DRAFT_1151773 [Russula dissimulans]
MILQLVGLDASYGLNCQRVVIIFTSVVYLANIAAYVYTTIKSHGQRNGDFCNLRRTVDTRVSIISTAVTDVVLVALMLFGILRWKDVWNGRIWWILYTQGLVWVVVITLAHVPSLIFIILNLNDPMNLPSTPTPQMFTIPGFVVLSIGASRMYRGLVESAALNVDVVSLDVRSPKTDIRFANISRHDDGELDGGDTPSVAGSTALDSNGLTSDAQLGRSLGSETA